MKRIVSTLVTAILAAGLLLGMAYPASASATRIQVTTFEYDCANELEQEWMEGQVYHIRNYHHTNRVVSDTPEVNGINTTVADAEIRLNTGYVAIRGTMSFKPDTIDGTWEGNWTFISNKGVVRGWSVAQGTGELFGKTLFVNIYDTAPTPEDQAMCAGLGDWEGNVITEGYILDSGG